MRTIALVLAAAFALSMPTAAVVKAEDTTIIKKDRDFDRDKVVIKKKEPHHMYMYDSDRDDVYHHRHRPGVEFHGPGVGVKVGR
jgi:hypothetical protein